MRSIANDLPDDMLLVLIGDMVTEEVPPAANGEGFCVGAGGWSLWGRGGAGGCLGGGGGGGGGSWRDQW